MDLSKPTHFYVGVKPCGCGVHFIQDKPSLKKDIVEMMRECVNEGLTVQRMTRDEVKPHMHNECCHSDADQGPLFAQTSLPGTAPSGFAFLLEAIGTSARQIIKSNDLESIHSL